MNAQQLIDKLRPLEGHRIRIVDADGNAHEQMCKSVEHLRPNERDGTQGNVILWNGEFTERGAMAGFTMTARKVASVNVYDYGKGAYGLLISIILPSAFLPLNIWRISDDKISSNAHATN